MAKHVLGNIDEDLDFALVTITCPFDQYEMVSIIDQQLCTAFYLSDEVPFNLKDNKLFLFSLFRFVDPELGLEYSLLPNLSNFEKQQVNTATQAGLFADTGVEERVRLVKELPKTDFLLLLKGEDKFRHQHTVIEKLRSADGILQVQAVDPAELPSRRNLIF